MICDVTDTESELAVIHLLRGKPRHSSTCGGSQGSVSCSPLGALGWRRAGTFQQATSWPVWSSLQRWKEGETTRPAGSQAEGVEGHLTVRTPED